jgi:DNA invertase Pin-like site-specific DNA recombinase
MEVEPMTKKVKAAVYARVSTLEQDTAAQENELKQYVKSRGWEVFRVYKDKISGKTTSRPALDELMGDARSGNFRCVVVWKFDRFGRSLRHLLTALDEFKQLKIDFISATEGIDTTTPGGELAFQIFGAMAQWERTLISERVKNGLREAVRKGAKLGRPPVKRLTAAEIEKVRAARLEGMTLSQISKEMGATMWTVYQASLR